MDVLTAILTRRSVPRLADPAPDDHAVARLLQAAGAAPDHEQLRPWRFVVFTGEGRKRLGEVYAEAHRQREPGADAGALEQTAAKPLRAPMIIAAICTPMAHDKAIPAWEQEAAVSAAVQNLVLAAHAAGFGAMWRTGWYGEAPAVRAALGLGEQDRVVGWIYVGTAPHSWRPAPRRPSLVEERTTWWR